MKKRWILALLLVLALVLTGCGSEEPQTGTVVAAAQPAETKPAATEAPATEAPETVPAETENPLSLGRLEGGSYINAYAGFGCDLDENWVFYSAEELQDLPKEVWEAMKDSELGAQVDSVEHLMDMQAENAELLGSMNVVYVKQDLASRLAFQLLSDEEAVDAILEQKDQMIEAYTQLGMENITIEKAKVNFLGEERWAMRTTCQIQGVDLYQVQVFNYRAGTYGVTLTCGSYLEDNTQAVLDLFYAVD